MAQLLAAGPPCELEGNFSFFQGVYKRYTPFALDFVEQRLEGSTFEFIRGGDYLMYSYLYSTSVVNWRAVLTSVDLLIGEQVIDSWPVEYLLDYFPILLGTTQSMAEYSAGVFLPLPLPRLPLCALRYHTVKIRLNGLTAPVKCQACMAYLSEAERIHMKDFDLLINQVQKKPVCTDGTVYLSHPVKFLWSNNVTTNRLLINGMDLWTNDSSIGLYYSTKYAVNSGFENQRSYQYMDLFKFLGTVPWGIRTLQSAKGNVFMFSSQLQQSQMAIYNMGPMNAPSSWTVIPFEYTDFGPPPFFASVSTFTGAALVQTYTIDLVPYKMLAFLGSGSFTVSSPGYFDLLVIGPNGTGVGASAGQLQLAANTLISTGTVSVTIGASTSVSSITSVAGANGNGNLGGLGAGGPGSGANGGPGLSQTVSGSNVYVFSQMFNTTIGGTNDGQNNFYYCGGGAGKGGTPGIGFGTPPMVLLRFRTA